MFKNLKVFTCLSILACNPGGPQTETEIKESPGSELQKTEWLIGEWQNITPEGRASEQWKKENDSVYTGQSYFVIGKDTVSSEKLSLRQEGEFVFYIPVVKGQNNGLPVKFKLTSSTPDHLVFENSSHDFPQKISYLRISPDSLLAEISGTMDGKPNSQKFPLARVK